MLYNTNQVLSMSNNEILKMIRVSKQHGYRFGDIVLNYPCSRSEHIKNTYLPQKKKFPNSIAIKYTNIYKETKSMGSKIGNYENIDENLSILMNLCNNINIQQKPCDNSLIAPIRLGDMIEKNKEGRDGNNLAIHGGTFCTRAGGDRHILSAQEIINEAKSCNCTKIVILGGGHGAGNITPVYLKRIMKLVNNEGYECIWYYTACADEDLSFISHAKNILCGPGGFALVAKAISDFRFNKNIQVQPIHNAINFV